MTGMWSFQVDGPIKGYIGTYKRSWTKEAKEYVAWKDYVRFVASNSRVPGGLEAGEIGKLSVTILWKKRARRDSPNVYKGIEDALFKKDRRVLFGEFGAVENAGREEVLVTFRIQEGFDVPLDARLDQTPPKNHASPAQQARATGRGVRRRHAKALRVDET